MNVTKNITHYLTIASRKERYNPRKRNFKETWPISGKSLDIEEILFRRKNIIEEACEQGSVVAVMRKQCLVSTQTCSGAYTYAAASPTGTGSGCENNNIKQIVRKFIFPHKDVKRFL